MREYRKMGVKEEGKGWMSESESGGEADSQRRKEKRERDWSEDENV